METVTISKTEYEDLLESQKILDTLYASGVDNWEWYDASLENLEEG
jgi:hypothetical protein